MKRNTVIAMVYGVAGVGLGVWLVVRGTSGRQDEASTDAAGVRVPSVMGEPAPGLVSEVGPDGIRWMSAAGGQSPAGTDVGRPTETKEEAEQRLRAFTAPALVRLPESGRELLRLADPTIQAVADLMTGAGVPEPVLETTLRGVFGHAQRLATFQRMAQMDAERAAELDREYAAIDPGERPSTPPPSLHWRAEVWQRRSQEYAEYMRRDLVTRLGIQDKAVHQRLIEIADDLFAREHGTAPEATATVETPR